MDYLPALFALLKPPLDDYYRPGVYVMDDWR
jgi:hypothetical protein